MLFWCPFGVFVLIEQQTPLSEVSSQSGNSNSVSKFSKFSESDMKQFYCKIFFWFNIDYMIANIVLIYFFISSTILLP